MLSITHMIKNNVLFLLGGIFYSDFELISMCSGILFHCIHAVNFERVLMHPNYFRLPKKVNFWQGLRFSNRKNVYTK